MLCLSLAMFRCHREHVVLYGFSHQIERDSFTVYSAADDHVLRPCTKNQFAFSPSTRHTLKPLKPSAGATGGLFLEKVICSHKDICACLSWAIFENKGIRWDFPSVNWDHFLFSFNGIKHPEVNNDAACVNPHSISFYSLKVITKQLGVISTIPAAHEKNRCRGKSHLKE